MKKAKQKRKPRRGDLVELVWLDATFSLDADENLATNTKRGGEPCVAVGYLSYLGDKAIVLCGELDKDGHPSRDFNCIPKGMVVKITVVKRHTFGERRNA